MDHRGAVGLAPHDLAVTHRDVEQPSVGQPAEPRRLGRHLDLDTQVAAVLADRADDVGVEVDEPQSVVMPAGALGEGHSCDDGTDLADIFGHASP